MTTVNNLVQGLLLGGLYALFATGLSVMFGVMRLVNLAHGDLSIVAAFLALVVVEQTGINPLLTLVVVVPVMFAVGYLLQRGVLNFTLGGDGLAPVLVTFGLSIILLTLATGVAALAGLQLMLSRTRLGRAFRATSDDAEAAQLVGIDHHHVFAV